MTAYAYAHCPKTGGTYVTRQLQAVEADCWFVGHNPARLIPPHIRAERVVFGTVRDAWGWYASWYLHCLRSGRAAREHLAVYGGGSLEWRDVLYGATHPTPERLPAQWGVVFGTCKRWDAQALLDSGAGLCSYAHQWVYGPGWRDVDLILPTNTLAQGLSDVLGLAVDPHPVNACPTAGVTYDDEQAAWVALAEHEHNSRCGWTAPEA